jgi:hypothetical protein
VPILWCTVVKFILWSSEKVVVNSESEDNSRSHIYYFNFAKSLSVLLKNDDVHYN